MNWGLRITIAVAAFIAMMAAMLIYAFRQDVNLVAEDYYAQEINYQDQIERIRNTLELPEKPRITYRPSDKIAVVQFPARLLDSAVEGTVHFYHPENPRKDQHLDLNVDSRGAFYIDASGLTSGNWSVKLNWSRSGIEYFDEKQIVVP